MMTIIGWACVGFAALLFVTGLVGFVSPRTLQGPNEERPLPRWKFLLAAWLGPLLPGAIGLSLLWTGSEAERVTPAVVASAPASAAASAAVGTVTPASRPDLGRTPEEFRRTYNKILAADFSDDSKRLALGPLKLKPGESADTFRQEIKLANVYLLGKVSKRTGNISDLVIGIGGGDAATSLRAMMVTMLATRSATGKKDVGNEVMAVLKEASEQLADSNKPTAAQAVGDFRLAGVGIKDVGIMVTLRRE